MGLRWFRLEVNNHVARYGVGRVFRCERVGGLQRAEAAGDIVWAGQRGSSYIVAVVQSEIFIKLSLWRYPRLTQSGKRTSEISFALGYSLERIIFCIFGTNFSGHMHYLSVEVLYATSRVLKQQITTCLKLSIGGVNSK